MYPLIFIRIYDEYGATINTRFAPSLAPAFFERIFMMESYVAEKIDKPASLLQDPRDFSEQRPATITLDKGQPVDGITLREKLRCYAKVPKFYMRRLSFPVSMYEWVSVQFIWLGDQPPLHAMYESLGNVCTGIVTCPCPLRTRLES